MGKPGRGKKAWLLNGPAAASPTRLCAHSSGGVMVLSGMNHQPALWPVANASLLVSEVLQVGLTESSCPFYFPHCSAG